jgi:hypothetical protein
MTPQDSRPQKRSTAAGRRAPRLIGTASLSTASRSAPAAKGARTSRRIDCAEAERPAGEAPQETHRAGTPPQPEENDEREPGDRA